MVAAIADAGRVIPSMLLRKLGTYMQIPMEAVQAF